MDSRAKQRLTGAVILVALFVLLVPELLTGPKNTPPSTAEEDGMRRYTIDLNAPTSTPGGQPAEPAVALPPVTQAPEAQSERAQPGESAAAAEPAPQPVPRSVDAPTADAGSPAEAVASKPVPIQPTPRAAPATVPAPATAVATPSPATVQAAPRADTRKPAMGTFVVQLGSFSSRENAERLVREMTAKGFATFIAPPIKTNGRELYRVRVGPTRDRASAEALAAQLKRMGQSGSIVPIS
jgi:cell division septation protein DedD